MFNTDKIFKTKKAGDFFIGQLIKKLVWYRNFYYTPKFVNNECLYKWIRSSGQVWLFLSEEVNPHILILGASGYGKSTLIKSIILDMKDMGIGAIIFDGHNEHVELLNKINGTIYDPNIHTINIFELDGLTIEGRINHLVELFNQIYRLGSLQEAIIRRALAYTYRKFPDIYIGGNSPNIRDFANELRIFRNNAKTLIERSRIEILLQKFDYLDKNMGTLQKINIKEFGFGLSLFKLSEIDSEELKSIYIKETVERIYKNIKSNGVTNKVKAYIIIDESKTVIEKAGRIIARIFTESRKFGYGVILVSNSAQLQSGIVSNASTIISFGLREPSDINYVSNIIAPENSNKANMVRLMLGNATKNQAVISSSIMKTPLLLKTPTFSDIDKRTTIYRNEKRTPPNPDILKKYGNRLISVNWVLKQLNVDYTYFRYLKNHHLVQYIVKDNKNEYIMNKNVGLSIEHESRLVEISKMLFSSNISNIINRKKGPDIIVYSKKSICIEYETGRKNIRDTIDMLANRNFDIIIVLVEDRYFELYKNIVVANIFLFRYSKKHEIVNFIKTTATN